MKRKTYRSNRQIEESDNRETDSVTFLESRQTAATDQDIADPASSMKAEVKAEVSPLLNGATEMHIAHHNIAKRAYELWQSREEQDTEDDFHIWLQAEASLLHNQES